MSSTYVVHYSEVALKGKNRPEFVRILRRNLRRALWGLDPDVSLNDGRFVVTTKGSDEDVAGRLGATFGVAWFSPASLVEPDYQKILSAVLERASNSSAKSFKIEARRSDKTFPQNSQELARMLGAAVADDTGMKVDLSDPDVVLHVDVMRSRAVVYAKKKSGPGGLPVGTAGRVLHLFSGGIDSPVAAWLLMKRGCMPVYVHFYLAPLPQAAIDSKITRLVKILSAYGGKSTLVLVPFAEYQLATAGAPGELEPSLFRRFMRMTAEALAPSFGATAVATGDSLSQAASQTLWNIAAFDAGSTIPVLRPLLTYDKEEIVSLARRISTYELSLEEYKDCCAIVTRHPRTRVKPELIDEYVRQLGLRDLVWRTLDAATLVSYNPVGDVMRSSPLLETLRRTPSLVRAKADFSTSPT
ncbi:MAG: tRNA 4-thiouridine(8) synthase ThiI [Thaumarchaeota archaeon]|nr:tRNA 4-thiouridine(8) synthase ThiI [Nitrososphaerota archaeon]